MKKFMAVVTVLVLVLSIAAVASANIFGGVEERIKLVDDQYGIPKGQGDVGGAFTAQLNATQEIYAANGITGTAALKNLASFGYGAVAVASGYISGK